MEEVIARRHVFEKKACLVFIFVGVLGLVLGVFFLVVKVLNLSPYPEDRQWVLIVFSGIEFIAGAFVIIWGIVNLNKRQSPTELIVFKDRKLTFAGGFSYDIKDVVEVTCKVPKIDVSGIGILKIVLKEGVIRYRQVENAAQACQRLTELIQQGR